MKTIHIAKAAPAVKSEPVESLTIIIDESVEMPKDLLEWQHFCDQQAALFCDAILRALPQGITDRILAELIKRKASLFILSQEEIYRHLATVEATNG